MLNGILHNPQWAESHLGNPIALYHSHPLNALSSLAPILFVGGVHGDEPEGVYLAEELLRALQQQAVKQPWALVTCLNPDGYKGSERTNGRGVDLNRNFPTPDWAKNEEGQRYYSGPVPNSEQETQALVRLIDNIKPSIVIHFHSWKPCIVFTGSKGKKIASLLSSLDHPAKEDIGYPTPGSLGQYGWLCKKTPVICIEEQEGASRDEVWENFGEKLLNILSIEGDLL